MARPPGTVPFTIHTLYRQIDRIFKNFIHDYPQVTQMWIFLRTFNKFISDFVSQWPELNRRPTPYHGVALPTELHRLI